MLMTGGSVGFDIYSLNFYSNVLGWEKGRECLVTGVYRTGRLKIALMQAALALFMREPLQNMWRHQ